MQVINRMEHWNSILYFCTYFALLQAQVTPAYRGVSENSIDPTPQKDRSAKLTTDFNRKPLFTECENYTPTVKEEQPSGTSVIQVQAEDNDPKDAGGTVFYKIIKREGERAYFQINNVTGEIVTSMSFDRDEPIRQKELYVTVQATDNGRPPLADICSFKVTVTDINDNAPSFDSQEYRTNVNEDTKPNSEVMRVFAYDLDDGENSRLTYNFTQNVLFSKYFRIDSETGVIYLQEVLGKGKKDTKFINTVNVYDNGNDNNEGPKSSKAEVSITVVGSDKQPPKIVKKEPDDPLILPENFIDFSKNLVTIVAESNMADKEVVFELVKGKTAQTNKDQTFLLVPESENSANIRLARPLDYEMVTEYTLTVRIKNKNLMDATVNIQIKLEDVNDEIPNFLEFLRGSVVENDDPGAQAIQVRAIDKDGTAANNIVSYELVDNLDIFSIDRTTGVITSKVVFDRERIALYHVNVRAYDNSPTALIPNSIEPNTVIQTFQISIEDQNDNKPEFTQSFYQFSDISESADRASLVGEVKAEDKDSASLITYSIVEGNIDNAFSMENTTGRIRVHGQLDFEKIEQYELRVKAFDGKFEDTARVIISILNENDERPVFENYTKEVRFVEEKLIEGCIITMSAYDPDIKNRSANQHIAYEVDRAQRDFLTVNNEGCVRLLVPLDRDPPYGSPARQVFIYALDNDGGTNSLRSFAEIEIILDDINDNAPFLNVTEIVWYENQEPGLIGQLSAHDYDGPENGPPFRFRLGDDNPREIRRMFSIMGDNLHALVTFDREERKFYDIYISITDSGTPPLTGVSILRVIIGDVNDNPAQDGESRIFVYKYVNGPDTDMEIGRVFVEDPDDWDLPDKVFVQQNMFDQFSLSTTNNGMILMPPTTAPGVYVVNYEVTETNEPLIPTHTVRAVVTITVKEIIEEAVRKSGSIRMQGSTIEEFVGDLQENGLNRKDILQQRISQILNTSLENVDVFTVIKSPNRNNMIDVRFSAHGSPYYAPERLNNRVTEHQDNLEGKLNVEFVMIGISACLNQTVCPEFCSCTNFLNISREPAVVFTNRTSFVGVSAVVDPVCDIIPREVPGCLNGGTPNANNGCICPEEFQGPHCEILAIGFTGNGWATYPTLDAWNNTDIQLTVAPQSDTGLIFYAGPLTARHAALSKDFISLELKKGFPLLRLNFGKSTKEIYVTENIKNLNDGAPHKVRITYNSEDVQIEIDECKSQCTVWKLMEQRGILNLNGPLQLGGTKFKFSEEEAKQIWGHSPPTYTGFYGCIRNLTYNGFYYNLGAPSDEYNSFSNCNYGVAQAVTFGIDSNFLVAILVCVAILIILLLAVVVHRRKQDNLNEKDIDDTRENIIDYEDEGGGECDANYDLSVFRPNNIVEEKPLMRDNPDVPADISSFLDTKKDVCDKDPDNLPFDDVRHYAYEGDGNSTGSLSSLASCTDEGDLKFNYLSNFGPRFRKLADMYGEDPSDEDSHDGGEESWC